MGGRIEDIEDRAFIGLSFSYGACVPKLVSVCLLHVSGDESVIAFDNVDAVSDGTEE